MAKSGSGRASQGQSASGAPPPAGTAPHANGAHGDAYVVASGPPSAPASRPSHHRAPSGDPQPRGPASAAQPRSQAQSAFLQVPALSRKTSGALPAPCPAVSAAPAPAETPAADPPPQGEGGGSASSASRQPQQHRDPEASQEEIEAALRCLLLGTIQAVEELGAVSVNELHDFVTARWRRSVPASQADVVKALHLNVRQVVRRLVEEAHMEEVQEPECKVAPPAPRFRLAAGATVPTDHDVLQSIPRLMAASEPPRMSADLVMEVIALEQARFGLLTHAAKSLLDVKGAPLGRVNERLAGGQPGTLTAWLKLRQRQMLQRYCVQKLTREGAVTATDLGLGKLANLVRYHCEQPPAKEEVRSAAKLLKRVARADLGPRPPGGKRAKANPSAQEAGTARGASSAAAVAAAAAAAHPGPPSSEGIATGGPCACPSKQGKRGGRQRPSGPPTGPVMGPVAVDPTTGPVAVGVAAPPQTPPAQGARELGSAAAAAVAGGGGVTAPVTSVAITPAQRPAAPCESADGGGGATAARLRQEPTHSPSAPPAREPSGALAQGQQAGQAAGVGLLRKDGFPELKPRHIGDTQEEWKASLAELLGWTGGTEQLRFSAQRHNAALEKALSRR